VNLPAETEYALMKGYFIWIDRSRFAVDVRPPNPFCFVMFLNAVVANQPACTLYAMAYMSGTKLLPAFPTALQSGLYHTAIQRSHFLSYYPPHSDLVPDR
ncbi:MAG: hypothetical protein ABI383_12410, partial [Acidobacteriaceae bacterium]